MFRAFTFAGSNKFRVHELRNSSESICSLQLKSSALPVPVRDNLSEHVYSDYVILYSMSPSAYEGLITLANDRRWCSDYARILRYLEVLVSLNEAVLHETETASLPANHPTWTQIAFMDDQIAAPAKRLVALAVIKKL
jgi:hypothetical protein